jgi:hypothetical protein
MRDEELEDWQRRWSKLGASEDLSPELGAMAREVDARDRRGRLFGKLQTVFGLVVVGACLVRVRHHVDLSLLCLAAMLYIAGWFGFGAGSFASLDAASVDPAETWTAKLRARLHRETSMLTVSRRAHRIGFPLFALASALVLFRHRERLLPEPWRIVVVVSVLVVVHVATEIVLRRRLRAAEARRRTFEQALEG